LLSRVSFSFSFRLGPLAVSLKERNIVKRAKLIRDEAAKTKPKEIEKNGDQDQKETTRYALEVSFAFLPFLPFVLPSYRFNPRASKLTLIGFSL